MMNTVQQMSSFEFQMVCVVRLLLASVCGFAIGIERTNRLKDAGMRTHLIVCMGAALMMLVSKYGFFDVSTLTEFFKADVSRVASSVVAGIGFLGAGIIFVRNRSITGLTTAAGIWTTAGIGMAMGAGMYLIAVAGTIILITAQSLLHYSLALGETLDTMLTVQGRDVPGYILDSKRLKESVTAMPMTEALADAKDGGIYVLFESGAIHYANGTFRTDHVWKIKF